MNKSAAFDILFVVWLLTEAWVFRRDWQKGPGKRRDVASRLVISLLMGAAIYLSFIATAKHWAPFPGRWELWFFAGAAVMAAGIWFRHRAVRWLGYYFRTRVTILDDHRLITDGPYAKLRHPSYTGSWLSCIGIGIAFGNAVALAAMTLLPLLAFVYRIVVEERAMSDAFGADWLAYRSHTSGLIPGLW